MQYTERADYGRSGAQYKKITVKTFSITLLIVLLSFQFILKIAPSTTVAFPDSSGEPVKLSEAVAPVASDSDGESTAEPEEVIEEEPVIVPKLVNTEYTITADYVPTNLTTLNNEVKGTASLQINETVFEAYKVMYADIMEAENVPTPIVISAYRSYAYQKQLYDKKVAQYGVGQKVTAVPGTSEHQYSGCLDLSTDGTCQNNFNQLPTGLWIKENSYKYGFVVRYPEGKGEITKINYEPWHIRYVGVEHATKMYELDMCLEEYVDYLRENYTNTVEEESPDDYPAPRFAGDLGTKDGADITTVAINAVPTTAAETETEQ